MWAVRVDGLPITKGSMKCVGTNGRHQLIEDQRDRAAAKEWRRRCTAAGAALLGVIGHQLDGPVSMEITYTLPAPDAARRRQWPWRKFSGDVDKLARMVLDAFSDSGVWTDDAAVVELTLRKGYPHTTAPDIGTEPGAVIRLWRTET